MNGIICIDKPEGYTSFDVVAVMRKATGERRIGHAGTLDPFATGVLPLLLGRSAKFQDYFADGRKKYSAAVRLGVISDTLDRTGETSVSGAFDGDGKAAERILTGFVGVQLQTPPAYSAIQVGGKRMYDLAREGAAPELPPRPVEIYSIDNILLNGDMLYFDVECSKGTYIRALARDIGEGLGCGGCLWELRRLAGSGFDISDCVSLGEAADNFRRFLRPTEDFLTAYEKVTVSDAESRLLLNGASTDSALPDGTYSVFDDEHGFLGLFRCESGSMKVRTMFVIKEAAGDNSL